MSFAQPWLLFALPLPALLLAWVWRRQGGRVAYPFDHVVRRRSRLLAALLATAESAPAILLAVVIVILAGPQQTGLPKTKRSLTNIQFCVDVSGSMSATFGEGTRYDASMKAINDFLDARRGDAFGLTFFGNEVLHWVPLTSDGSALKCAPPFMHPRNPNRPQWFGGTEIGKALLACRDVLVSREKGDRMIILVSDGWSADLQGDRPEEIARDLSGENIVVYAIHIDDSDVPPPISTIASMTGGEVFNPGDDQALNIVFGRIDKMEQARLERTLGEAMDYFYPFCLVGMSLLGACTLSLYGLRYTPW